MNELLEILQSLHPDIDFEENKNLIDDGILDSFDIISLIAEITNEYDISIPAEEIIPENFNNVDAIYALITRLIDEDF